MMSEYLKTAQQAALAAGEILERYFCHAMEVKTKNKAESDYVTSADTETEGAIKQMILSRFPDHGFWGEEGGQEHAKREYLWVVDPLDSTSNFTYRIPLYSTSIALLHHGEVIVGVIYVPGTEELFHAEKSQGSFCNHQAIQASKKTSLDQSVCAIQYRSTAGEFERERGLDDFTYFARRTKKIRYLSATVFELCRVARGDLDFAISDGYFIDFAAAKLILQEA